MSEASVGKMPEATFRQAVPECLKIYGFDVFNLGAYFCAAGPVLGLFVKHLGGSTTFLGLVMACMPACQLMQMFIAPSLENLGIKRAMVGSLAMRNFFHTLLACLPFVAGWLAGFQVPELTRIPLIGGFFSQPNAIALAVFFVIMLSFDFCQGVGFAGWMTWVNWLVPEKYRGRYFAFEQMMNNFGQMVFSALAGFVLGDQGSNANYGTLFLIGAVCGWTSIVLLGRVKAIPRKAERSEFTALNLSWIKTIWPITPYRRMMYVILAHQMMMSVGIFFVYFQKDVLMLTDRFLMAIATVGIIGGFVSVYIWGTLADRFGSKPVMALAYYLILGSVSYWLALALGFPLAQKPLILLMQFGLIAGFQGYVVTNMRYVLGSLPKDRVVFGTVFYNLMVQVSTMAGAMIWGRLLDVKKLDSLNLNLGSLRVDRFTIVFACMLGLAVLARIFVHRLENLESKATAWHALCYMVRRDAAAQGLLTVLLFALLAVPLSYLFQSVSLKSALPLADYCSFVLQGMTPDASTVQTGLLRLRVTFWSTLSAVLLTSGFAFYKLRFKSRPGTAK